MAEICRLVDLANALHRFAFPTGPTQSQQHIRPLHWYIACRLVLEGGFHPNDITPRPPFNVRKTGGEYLLDHNPESGGAGERTVFGGLKTKNVDVVVCKDGIGPVIAVSAKGTLNAFRNLTNRMEEAAGDCTNLHLSYPALVHSFWSLLRGNEEADESPEAHFALSEDGRYEHADIALLSSGDLSNSVARYAAALGRLSGRDDLRDEPSRYEACGLTLVDVRDPARVWAHLAFPGPGEILDYNHMFERIYKLYDRRFVYQAPALAPQTRRLEWSHRSPFLEHTLLSSPDFAEFQPRMST